MVTRRRQVHGNDIEKMATCVLRLRGTGFGRTKTFLLRGFVVSPSVSQTSVLPSILPTINDSHKRTLRTTVTRSDKQLFELTKNAKQGSQHWMVERIVAVGLLAAVPAGIFYPAPIIDHSLAVLLPLHAYWGVNAIIGDYLFRPLVPLTKLAWGMTCVISFAGLMYLNVHDVGICKSVTMVMNL